MDGGGYYVDVRVWRMGMGVAASLRTADVLKTLVDVLGVDTVLGVLEVSEIVGHLKRRVSEQLEKVRRDYLERRAELLSRNGARWLLGGEDLDGHERRVAEGVFHELRWLGVVAQQLVSLQRLLDGLDEWLSVYQSLGRVDPRELDTSTLYHIFADADDIAGVPQDDQRLHDLLERVEAVLGGGQAQRVAPQAKAEARG